jgi:hypothetical protein
MSNSSVANLNERRAMRAGDSTLWTAEDALRAALRDIEDGTINPERLVIHLLEPIPEEDGGGKEHHYYVANASFDEHVALLELAKVLTIDRWRQ